MCRWLAYSGSPILLEELLYKPEHSLIDQSLHARLGVETTNGDGFGVGWYDANAYAPAIFRSVEPAWNDRNLREVAALSGAHPCLDRDARPTDQLPPVPLWPMALGPQRPRARLPARQASARTRRR